VRGRINWSAGKGRIRVAPKEERTMDGIVFASKAEMRRYAELKMLERSGAISRLELQPHFTLQDPFVAYDGTKQRAITYVGDFTYRESGKTIVEDCKGMKTEKYRIKRKLFLFRYPHIIFREVQA
jgi:hypothetical protein